MLRLTLLGLASRRRSPPRWPSPRWAARRPQSMRMVVDLPAPLGPRKPKISPLATVQVDAVHGHEVAEALGQSVQHHRGRPPCHDGTPAAIGSDSALSPQHSLGSAEVNTSSREGSTTLHGSHGNPGAREGGSRPAARPVSASATATWKRSPKRATEPSRRPAQHRHGPRGLPRSGPPGASRSSGRLTPAGRVAREEPAPVHEPHPAQRSASSR